jgi:hypothetical protein
MRPRHSHPLRVSRDEWRASIPLCDPIAAEPWRAVDGDLAWTG